MSQTQLSELGSGTAMNESSTKEGWMPKVTPVAGFN